MGAAMVASRLPRSGPLWAGAGDSPPPGGTRSSAPGMAPSDCYAALFIESFMAAEALLAASCKVLDDR